MGRMRDRLDDFLFQARHADVELGTEEPGGAGLSDVYLDIHGIVGRQRDLLQLGCDPKRGDVTGRPRASKQLLGFRVRFGGDELEVVTGGRRQLDVDDAVLATLGVGVTVDRVWVLPEKRTFSILVMMDSLMDKGVGWIYIVCDVIAYVA